MKEILIKILNFLGLAYWVEISTDSPKCTYYFGPFLNQEEAKAAQKGYVEDLQSEGTLGIFLKIKRFKPNNLTIFDDLEGKTKLEAIPSYSQ